MSQLHDRENLIGKTLAGAYRLEAIIGQGAMGIVYRARHNVLDQDFAVKVIAPDVAQEEQVRARLIQEARTLALLSHRHIIAVRHCGEEDGLLYVVMDLCPGETLRTIIDRDGALSESRARATTVQVLDALEEAHAQGIVHRDLKPDNIMVAPLTGGGEEAAGHVRVLDFGLARVLDEARARLPGAMVSADQQVIGTVAYMSPEQVRASKDVDGRSDVYSLGVVLYEMLTGALPFDSDSSLSVMLRILETPPPSLPEGGPHGVSRDLRAIVVRALMKEPQDRFQDAAAFRAALEGRLDPRNAPARTTPDAGAGTKLKRWRGLAVAVGLAALLGLGIGLWPRDGIAADRAAAKAALSSCDLAGAARALHRVVGSGEGTDEDRLALAEILIKLEDPEADAVLALAARGLGASDSRVLMARARLAWHVDHNVLAALEHVGAAAVADAHSVEPVALRIEVLLSSYARAEGLELPRARAAMLASDLETLERRAPDDPRTIYTRGQLQADRLLTEGRVIAGAREVAVVFELAGSRDPAWADPPIEAARLLATLAYQLATEGHADAAKEPAAEALALANQAFARLDAHPQHRCQGNRRAWFLEQRALVRMHGGEYEAALEDVRAVYAARKDLSAFRKLADTLRTHGRLDEAIELYTQLIEATQDRAAWFDLGYCWQQRARERMRHGDWDAAHPALLQAVEAYDSALTGHSATFVDLAYRGETHLLLADLPGTDRAAALKMAGRDFDAARAAAPKAGSTEVEYRRASYLCARGRPEEAQRDLRAAMAQEQRTTQAVRARLAWISLAALMARRVRVPDLDPTAALAVVDAELTHVRGMFTGPSVVLSTIQAERVLMGALLAEEASARAQGLLEASGHAQAALAAAADWPAWAREGVALRSLMLRRLRGAPSPAAELLATQLRLDLAAGRLRRTPAALDALAVLCAARGDADGARRARGRAEALRGE